MEAEELQHLLGRKVLRLLRALDPNEFTLAKQRQLLTQQIRPQELLSKSEYRARFIQLLYPVEAQQLCRLLRVPTISPYEQLAGVTFRGDRLRTLLDFFELPTLIEEPLVELPSATQVLPTYGLFAHQSLAAARCIRALEGDERRVLLHMPTGSGKTRTAMHVIAHRLRTVPGKSVLWLAHSEELCEQAATEFTKTWTSLGNREITVHRFWGDRALDPMNTAGDFLVCGLKKMTSAAKRSIAFLGALGERTSMVVLDEAHQAVAPTYQLILEALVEPFQGRALLGLSATPGRTWNDVDADEELAKFFGRSKVTLEIEGYANPLDFLVAEGYLARPIYRPLAVNSALALSPTEVANLSDELDVPLEVLERLAEDEVRNLALLREIEQLTQRHKRLLIFATTVEHSDLLAFTLRSRGIWARSVTGRMAPSERQRALLEYKDSSDEPRVLCNFGVLTVGFDAPSTSAALIARPTKSLVLYSQMVGRAIRGRLAGGNDEAEIVTVIERGLPGFGDLGEAFRNWEDVWGGNL